MKSKWSIGISVSIIFLLMSFPFVLDILIKNDYLSFSPGAVDSWIDFWGTYVGAVIGASVVYFVAIIQTQKQNAQQMAAIELRGKYELQREMKFFHTTKVLEKTEEFIEVADELLDHILVIYSSITQIAHALTKKEKLDEQEVMNYIEELQLTCSKSIEQSQILLNKIDLLAYYTGLDEQRVKIITRMQALIYEYEQIEQHYEKYDIANEKIAGGITLSGVAAEAADMISGTAQQLRQTLTNIQSTLLDMGNKNY